MGKAGKGTGSFGACACHLFFLCCRASETHADGFYFLLQVKGATRLTHSAEGVAGGLSTFKSLHARHVATQQPVSGNVRDLS